MEYFDYLNSNVSQRYSDSLKDRSRRMIEREIHERAKLLHNLGYTKDQAIHRIHHNLAWEFDDAWTNKQLPAIKQVKKLVTEYYKRMQGKRD